MYQKILEDKQVPNITSSQPLSLAPTIRRLREEKGMTQKALADSALIDYRTMASIEKGRIQNPALSSLERIARSLDLSLKDLFGVTEAMTPSRTHLGDERAHTIIENKPLGIKWISYTPLVPETFCGKLLVGGKKKVTQLSLNRNTTIFLQLIFGKLEVTVEGRAFFLKEGNHLLFNGHLEHAFSNPLAKEANCLFFTTPNFLTCLAST